MGDDNGLGVFLVASTLLYIIGYNLGQRKSKEKVVDMSLKGLHVVITGANTGIGYAVAHKMASKGADVILGCRDEKKGKAAAESILKTVKGVSKVQHRTLDLTDFRSIRKFVSEIDHCDILINNAGAMFPKHQLVPVGSDAVEKTFLTNYLGPFYLTMRLLPVLLKRSSSFPTEDGISSAGIAFERRIVNVGSRLEKNSSFRGLSLPHEAINDILRDAVINGKHSNSVDAGKISYNMWTAYANSKLCNLLFTFELSRKLSEGSYGQLLVGGGQLEGLAVNAVTPGMVNTDLSRWLPLWQRLLVYPVLPWILRSPSQGAESVMQVALSPALNGVTGKFLEGKAPPLHRPIASSEASHSTEISSALWAESLRLVEAIDRHLDEEDAQIAADIGILKEARREASVNIHS